MAEITAVILAALVHELGHITAARLLRVRLVGFSLTSFGGLLQYDFSRASYPAEAAVHFAGGFVGISSGIAAYALLGQSARTFLGASVLFTAVNFLPIRGFDGGALLNSLLLCFFDPDIAYKTVSAVSFAASLVLWLALSVCAAASPDAANPAALYFAVSLLITSALRGRDFV